VVKTLALVIMIFAVSPARADNTRLDEARAAVDSVRYDRARTLLLAALQAGGNSPRELAEIYRLSAITAIVLGDRTLAESYYRRWLALEPDAVLPKDLAPKLREPFEAVRADMAQRGKLAIAIRGVAGGVEVAVDADPMQMAVVAVLDDTRVPIVNRAARIAAAPGARSGRVAILDEDGNHIIEADVAIEAVATSAVPPAPAATHAPAVAIVAAPSVERPWLRRPSTWTIAGGGFLVLGIAFSIAASSVRQDALIEQASGLDLGNARGRLAAYETLETISFVATGACVVTALVMYATGSKKTAVVPSVSGTGAGASFLTRW
jgi:hypothetical protein